MRSSAWFFVRAALIGVILIYAVPQSRAASFSVGPVVWYSWWRPFFENYLRGHDLDAGNSVRSSFAMKDSAFHYGPYASYSISDRWSVAGGFIFSIQRGYHASGQYPLVGPGYFGYAGHRARQVDRYDLDATASYALNKIFSVCIRAKSQVHNYSGAENILIRYGAVLLPLQPAVAAICWSAGAGFGAGMNLPLADNLSLVCNLSAVCLPGKNENNGIVRTRDPFVSYGGEGDISLAYYFQRINGTISIGGRYQILRYSFLPGADADMGKFDSPFDHFYGITVSALFLF